MESLGDYLEALASAAPTPGGGSAATIVASLGAALVAMVARICAQRPKDEAAGALAAQLLARAEQLRKQLGAARSADEAAFAAVVTAQALPKNGAAEAAYRAEALERALAHAAAAPLHAAELACDVVQLAVESLALRNRNLVSDLGCAAEFGASAVAACAYNVRINHRFMHDAATIAAQENTLARVERESRVSLDALRMRLHG